MRIFTKQKIIKIEFTRIIIVSVVLFLLIVPTASAVDCGLRVYNGTKILKIDCESAGTLTSPLRIRKGATTYGIVLVPTTDANALPIRINTSSGVKALKKIYPWSTKAAMPTARGWLAAVAVNNIIYAIGGRSGSGYPGFTNLATNEAYDPATNNWLIKAAMPTARHTLAAVAVNNIIYAIGGYIGPPVYDDVATNEAYDPSTNTWVSKAPMPTARGGLAAVAVNNIIYAIGGSNASYFSTNEAYDPSTNTWVSKAPMPTARDTAAAAAGNIIYAIGGWNGSSLSINEAYDPSTNTWSTKASMPTARDTAAAAAGNIIYAIGGWNGSSLSINEAYDPSTNTWSTKTVMPIARSYLAATAVNNIIYAIGGWNTATNEAYDPE